MVGETAREVVAVAPAAAVADELEVVAEAELVAAVVKLGVAAGVLDCACAELAKRRRVRRMKQAFAKRSEGWRPAIAAVNSGEAREVVYTRT